MCIDPTGRKQMCAVVQKNGDLSARLPASFFILSDVCVVKESERRETRTFDRERLFGVGRK